MLGNAFVNFLTTWEALYLNLSSTGMQFPPGILVRVIQCDTWVRFATDETDVVAPWFVEFHA